MALALSHYSLQFFAEPLISAQVTVCCYPLELAGSRLHFGPCVFWSRFSPIRSF